MKKISIWFFSFSFYCKLNQLNNLCFISKGRSNYKGCPEKNSAFTQNQGVNTPLDSCKYSFLKMRSTLWIKKPKQDKGNQTSKYYLFVKLMWIRSATVEESDLILIKKLPNTHGGFPVCLFGLAFKLYYDVWPFCHSNKIKQCQNKMRWNSKYIKR